MIAARCGFEDGFSVLWTADGWGEARALSAVRSPEVVVVDADRDAEPPCDLSEGAKRIRYVLIVPEISSSCLERYRRLKAYAVLLREEPLSALILCLKQVGSAMRAADHAQTPGAGWSDGRRMRVDSPLKSLTPRQMQILSCLARGDSVKEAAASLSLTAKSVTNHKYRIMQKLGVNDRVKLARLAIREGLIEP